MIGPLQLLLQRSPRSVDFRLNRSQWEVHDLGDFLVRFLFLVAKQDHEPIVSRQASDCCFDHAALGLRHGLLFRVLSSIRNLQRFVFVVQRNCLRPLTSEMVNAKIGGNLEQPRRECVLRVVTGEGTECLDKRLLGQILRVFPLPHSPVDQTENRPLIPAHKQGVGILSPLQTVPYDLGILNLVVLRNHWSLALVSYFRPSPPLTTCLQAGKLQRESTIEL